MFTSTESPRARTRTRRLIIVVVLLVVAVAVVLVARQETAPPSSPPTATPPGAAPSPAPTAPVDEATALAIRPMLTLPPEAALPHELTTATAGPPITVPRPAPIANRVISDGFPATAEGALGWLTDFNETALRGGDPATYLRAYGEAALPHAPSPQGNGLLALLTAFRDEAGIRAGELKPGLTVTYEVTQGLIKGTVDDGRFVVVCTLGQLSFDYQGEATRMGIGDCQALRWTGTAWRIAPGARAAYAASAWPGSAESVAAGYRPLNKGGVR
ncbi:hypothetical protein SAMN05421837_111301 [Amycolatopsis pretoriensis]|uniref:Uncharacterized protein n=1 Tax=Amycolatopsis pretoriensis TaxID=218821 RepID=A0A1H5REU6_9PSEU|nr:hypothetical protein [Amycolatopsis pretoriensis]SEF36880.1 hypothetical protein SAMN05421837_111301 [Amycolatopsis pretoriensis]